MSEMATKVIKQTLKVLIVGPSKSGKTTYANLICLDASSSSGEQKKRRPYEPTLCRILETEVQNTAIELWDIGGDSNYEHLWKAMTQGVTSDGKASKGRVDGVILVYNRDEPAHAEEALLWYDRFVRDEGVPDRCCLVLSRTKDAMSDGDAYSWSDCSGIPRKLEECVVRVTDMSDGKEAKANFSSFVEGIINRH